VTVRDRKRAQVAVFLLAKVLTWPAEE
jgi:hypothetical protein